MNKFDFADEMRVSIDLEDLKTVSLVIEFDDEMIVQRLSIEIDEQTKRHSSNAVSLNLFVYSVTNLRQIDMTQTYICDLES